jgi:hypothetical protein
MKRTILVIAGAAVAMALATAQDARADESSFLRAMGNDGLPVGVTALTLGHQVCSDIIANGVDGVDSEVRQGFKAGMSATDVASVIFDATTELCPSALPAAQAWAEQHRTPHHWWAT